jgi:hypothetical protein
MPITPALRRPKQDNLIFETSLDYRVTPCLTNENNIKIQTRIGGNFAKYISNNGLVLTIYNPHTKSIVEKTNDLCSEWTKYLKRHFKKQNMKMMTYPLKRQSTALVTKKMLN